VSVGVITPVAPDILIFKARMMAAELKHPGTRSSTA
jgi:hypothetical protein